jgi:hypothetical protein
MKVKLPRFNKNTRQLVLYRGMRYFEEQRMKKISEVDNTYVYQVHGEVNHYEVVINVAQDDTIVFSSCTCPYEDGGFCKHQVSAYFDILNTQGRLHLDDYKHALTLKEKHPSKPVPQGWSKEDYIQLQQFNVKEYMTSFTKEEIMDLMVAYMKQDMKLFMYLFHHYMVEEEKNKIKGLS